ncbi:MAG: hypothetical protein LQ345_001060 [Seirophora villosa]|nr:MAG: hypothetical protein LQ345_001060 [Seirophora villosa]
MATNDFRDHSNQLDADCKTLKRLLNDAEELYDCGSSTRILFCDLRDELVFSLYTLSCLLEQITTFYNLWKSKTGPSRNRRESNALVAGTSRRKKLGIVYLTTVWREVRDSRHLIMSYARLIDSYHQRRNMPGRIDGILTRVDSLYSSIDAAGHAFVYPHQISPNAQLLELLQSVAATKRKLLAISRFFRDFVHLKKLLAPYAHNFLKDAETVNVSLDMLEEHLIRPSVVVYRRTTTNKTDDPALQNGSSVSLQAQGSKGNNSSQVKRLLPTVGPKRPHSQAGAATNVLSHTPGISRPQSTACLAPTAPDLGRNALSHQSCRQSSQPLMKGHISELWLDFYRLRQLSLAVTRSIEALADMLRLPTSKDIDNVYMNHFLLCAVESHHWKCFEFSKTSHDARLCTGFREERERATHKLGACTGSSVLERLHDESRTDATRARMQEELRNGDEAPYLLKKLETSHNRIKRITRELIDCRTDRFISVSILSRKTITTTLKGFQLSFNTLYPELSQLQKEILADKRIISFGLLPSLMVCRQSPVYPRLRGKAIHDFRVGLLKLGFQNVTSASKPRVAAFHTSAATRRPPVTDDAALRNEQPLEEETDQVSRSNDASDAQAGSLIGYCIPEVRMRECLQAPRTARSAYWQYTLYEGPKAEKVKVHYCKSLETSERIAKRFLNERVIGFDIEWKPQASAKEGIRKNVAVIQLASEDRIAIFHLARFSKGDSIDELVAPSLRRIMESASITKVGVSIKSDCTRVRKFLGINSRGLFELSHLYKLVKYATNDVKKINKMLVSLATQTEQHLLLPMYKDESVRSSDWSEDLNYEQIYYAASDSYAGFQLYHSLNQKRLALIPPPPLPAHADLNLPIRLANGQTVAEYEDPSAEEPLSEPSSSPSIAPLSPTDALAEDVMNLQIEDTTPPSPSPSEPEPTTAPSLSSHPSFIAANDWVTRYRASHPLLSPKISSTDLSYPLLPSSPHTPPIPSSTSTPPPPPPQKTRATPSLLRAYFLFHHHRLSVPDIAALLRAPPLQRATVAGYVLEAARVEGLQLEAGRVQECLKELSLGGRGRYRGLKRRLGVGVVGGL